MIRNYKFRNPEGIYFVSFAVVEWLDVFTRKMYCDILVENLQFYSRKGMVIYAWCIMSNHVHLVFRSNGDTRPEVLLGNFKRFTSKAIVQAIKDNPKESRKKVLLEQFRKSGERTSNVKQYQFWSMIIIQ